MRHSSTVRLCVALLLLPAAVFAQHAPPTLKDPGRIYVGTMGESDRADEFRGMLDYELGRAGFKVTDFKPQADTTLTGLLAVRAEDDKSVARVTVFLKNKQGKTLWTGDFGATSTPMRLSESMRRRAEEVAAALKKQLAPPPPTRSR